MYCTVCVLYTKHLTISLMLQVTVARFSSRVPFTSQLTMAHNTDILVGEVLLITMLLITMLLLTTTAGGAARGGPHPPPVPPRLGGGAGALQLWRRPLLPRPRQVSGEPQPTRRKPAWGSLFSLILSESYNCISLNPITAHETNLYLLGWEQQQPCIHNHKAFKFSITPHEL